ncbi:cysteine proteinase [Aulographum hederae CBS 113979]|uniref:Cysteine proteinase n=1 Tax=Aulographum hederae CBS 113979 TaxID=1176131 RepID=A0A6G1GVV7_9PEZI|nr:cysteine proteinase [Aulographum hederae CBS 113979]
MPARSRVSGDAPQVSRPPSHMPSPSRDASRAPSMIFPSDEPLPPRRVHNQAPQKTIDEFWANFTSKTPGKAFTILPHNLYAKRAAAQAPKGVIPGQNAVASYEEARLSCVDKVEKIVKECRRTNQKYRDSHFDIEADLKDSLQNNGKAADCLMGLRDKCRTLRPQSVKRVEDVFEKPEFFIEGASATDVRQGKEGDCWFMAALCTLSNKEGLIKRVCVARDEKVGVYGFVFHRDGEWRSEVIDDKLYLIKEDFHESLLERNKWLELQNRARPEEEYRTVMQTGSRALYFAQCSDANETWLPLLEKAYAKAHGDYSALDSGFVGEGIEDLTGGVTTELFSTDILDKEKFWNEELKMVNKQFLFGCGQMGGKYGQRQGILEKHAYSIMEAREIKGERLLKLRNPWGNTEWKGAWSDGSAEWTPEWMQLLDHQFGDDGVFWISYKDLLRNYQHFDRTRLFGPEWTVTQQWTSLHVPWSVDYHDTKFQVTLTKPSHVVIVLSQLDDRYFRGLEGQYEFYLQFRLHKEGEDDYIVRSNRAYYMRRSVSTELDLDAGTYHILLKIVAKRYPEDPTPEEVIRNTCHTRREKLLSIGLSYDLAHAKGKFREIEDERKEQEKKNRYELKKANAKKAYEYKRKQKKKTKLRNVKNEIKQAQRQAQREQRMREQQERDTVDPTETARLEKKLAEYTLSESNNGLGITNGHYDNETTKSNGVNGTNHSNNTGSGIPTPAPTPLQSTFTNLTSEPTSTPPPAATPSLPTPLSASTNPASPPPPAPAVLASASATSATTTWTGTLKSTAQTATTTTTLTIRAPSSEGGVSSPRATVPAVGVATARTKMMSLNAIRGMRLWCLG